MTNFICAARRTGSFTMARAKETELSPIKRRAIDSSGHVGSPYNIHQDRVLRCEKLASTDPIRKALNHIECRLIYGTREKLEKSSKDDRY